MSRRTLSPIGVDDDPTVEDLVGAALQDKAFGEACAGIDRERRAKIAETAISAAFVYLGLVAMVQDIEHERCGHG